MAQYPPQPHTLQPVPPPGSGAYGSRSRASSNASMNKYVPESYQTPQPGSQAEANDYFPPQRPRGPSIGGQPITPKPPVPNSYPGPGSQFLQAPSQSSNSGTPAYTPGARSAYTPGAYTPNSGLLAPPYPQAVNELRPPQEPPRRPRDASTHSRHSHRSHHSGRRSDSQERSNRRRRSYEDEYDYEKDRKHRGRERRASAPDPDGKDKLSRTKTRPTLGDTMYSSFRNIKYWLGPRDKY